MYPKPVAPHIYFAGCSLSNSAWLGGSSTEAALLLHYQLLRTTSPLPSPCSGSFANRARVCFQSFGAQMKLLCLLSGGKGSRAAASLLRVLAAFPTPCDVSPACPPSPRCTLPKLLRSRVRKAPVLCPQSWISQTRNRKGLNASSLIC